MNIMSIRPVVATAAALALALTACGGSDDDSADAAAPAVDESSRAESTFPVSIEHVYGTTTIDERPERVATVAWANHEVPLALGVVPVGMSMATWGDDDGDGVLPWVEDQLEALGAEVPVLFDETDGIDFEAVADTEPDVILAAYSGITQEDYDTLSSIAPTIAYPDVAWGTSVEDMIRLNSAALGLAAQGDALIDDLDAQIDAALAAHPELEGQQSVVRVHRPDRSQPGGLLHEPRHPPRLPRRHRPADTRNRRRGVGEYLGVLRDNQLRTRRPLRRRRSVRHLRRGRRRDHRSDPGRPAAVDDPGRRQRFDCDPGELDPARRVGEPVAAVDRLGHRRLLRTPRRWTPADRMSLSAIVVTRSDGASVRRPAVVRAGWLAGLCCLLAVLVVVSVAFGTRGVTWVDISGALFGTGGGDELSRAAVVKRLPRTVLALLVGSALSVSGTTMQAITRNPLAEPGILGVSSGAALAVVIGVAFVGISDPYAYMALAVAGAAAAAVVVYLVGSLGRGGASPLKLALAGAAMTAAFGSLVNAILLPARRRDVELPVLAGRRRGRARAGTASSSCCRSSLPDC